MNCSYFVCTELPMQIGLNMKSEYILLFREVNYITLIFAFYKNYLVNFSLTSV